MSVSEKQIQANRENAKKAGVKTEIGKEIVRHNSFKHGLTSKALLSEKTSHPETEELYMSIYEGLKESFSPRNFFEETLLDTMARAQLKMRRYEVLETEAFRESRDPFDVISFRDQPILDPIEHRLMLALKYKGAIEAQYYRALSALLQSRQPKQMDLFLPEGGSNG